MLQAVFFDVTTEEELNLTENHRLVTLISSVVFLWPVRRSELLARVGFRVGKMLAMLLML